MNESLKSLKGFLTVYKEEGIVNVVWGNDLSILVDIYIILAFSKIITFIVNKNGQNYFGISKFVKIINVKEIY